MTTGYTSAAADGSAAGDSPRDSHVVAVWLGEHRFDTSRPAGPSARVDGEGITAQSPPDILLSALATCSAIDVIDILAKRRTPVERLVVDVLADRRPQPPRRFVRIDLEFRVDGAGIEAVHAERAIELAFDKYCTVAASLGPDIDAFTRLVLNGEPQPLQRQAIWTPPAAG